MKKENEGVSAETADAPAHTPGPWSIRDDRHGQANIYGPGDEWIALLPHECITSKESQMIVDARLIRAAPDLYRDLRKLHGILQQTVFYDRFPELLYSIDHTFEKISEP